MRRLFCYVDETGQDTRGELFVVAVVIAEEDVEIVRRACERIELESGKRAKWIKTKYARRLEYIRRVLAEPVFRGRLFAALYKGRRDYLRLTLEAVAQSLAVAGGEEYEATIRIDGLPRTQERLATLELRRMGVAGGRVKGVRKDENDTLIRLADALCGLCRAAREGQPEMQVLWQRAARAGAVRELGK
jgi:hypothetical protein